jgi:hypothetical protein
MFIRIGEEEMIGEFAAHVPPAARTLAIAGSVYGIMFAAKKNDWVCQYINGWLAVGFNFILTVLGLLVVVPAEQLYTLNTFTAIVVGVLSSSGIHGMSKAIPASQAQNAAAKASSQDKG